MNHEDIRAFANMKRELEAEILDLLNLVVELKKLKELSKTKDVKVEDWKIDHAIAVLQNTITDHKKLLESI